MKKSKPDFKVCSRGHRYLKTGAPSVCPVCWPSNAARKAAGDFPAGLAAPARRALHGAGIVSLAQLASRSETELLELHGMGPKSIRALKVAMRARGLSFAAG
jgi:hypothetical protein